MGRRTVRTTPTTSSSEPVVTPSVCEIDGHRIAVAALVFDSDDQRRHADRIAITIGQVSTYTVERGDGEMMLVIVGPPAHVSSIVPQAQGAGAIVALSNMQACAIARRWLDLARTAHAQGDSAVRHAIRWPTRTGADQ